MAATLLAPSLAEAFDEARRPASETPKIAAAFRAVPHTGWQRDPVGWAAAVLGVPAHTLRWSLNPGYFDEHGVAAHRWDGTADPIAEILEAVARGESVACESATGTGKSFAVAVLILWFTACWEGARSFTFAPTEKQLELYIWAEIGKLWPGFQAHFPTAELSSLRILMNAANDDADSWGVWGRAIGVKAGEAINSRAAGMHAEHLLLVNEETQGMAVSVLEAQENTCTAPHNIRVYIGNPDNQHDALHKASMSPGVTAIRASAYDHPNVVTGRDIVPGAVSRESIERRRTKYGRNSSHYKSRVRGISPPQSSEALILREWLDAAVVRYRARVALGPITGQPAKGVDVAQSKNGDKASIADFRGNACIAVRSFQCENATTLGTDVWTEARRDGVRPEYIGVDPVGVGAATMNELRAKFADDGSLVQALNGGFAPVEKSARAPDGSDYDWIPDDNVFGNLRAQMWWAAREDLRLGVLDMAPNEALFDQLTLVESRRRAGKVWVESKEEIRARTGGASPDDADAFVYGNWVRARTSELETRDVVPEHPAFANRPRMEKDRDTRARFLDDDEVPPPTLDPATYYDVGPGVGAGAGSSYANYPGL